MPLRLPRLQASIPITASSGRPSSSFALWWQNVAVAVEGAVNDLVDVLVRLGLVEVTADGALELAESAIKPGGEIKEDKVTTDSLANNSATIISSVFFDAAATAIGTSGSYVAITDGASTAVVSVATGTKETQQVFVDAWIGVRRGSGANEMVTFRCVRNDATILAQTYTHEATNDQSIMPMAFLDPTPDASATHTYTIEASSTDAATQIREVFVKGFLGKTG